VCIPLPLSELISFFPELTAWVSSTIQRCHCGVPRSALASSIGYIMADGPFPKSLIGPLKYTPANNRRFFFPVPSFIQKVLSFDGLPFVLVRTPGSVSSFRPFLHD